VQARLQAFAACKYEYEKETAGKSKLVTFEPQVMLHQMTVLMTQIEVVPKVKDSEISGIGAEACKYLLGQLCGDVAPIARAMFQGFEVLLEKASTLPEKETEQYLMVLVRMDKFVSRMQQLLDQDRASINTEMLLDPKVPPQPCSTNLTCCLLTRPCSLPSPSSPPFFLPHHKTCRLCPSSRRPWLTCLSV